MKTGTNKVMTYAAIAAHLKAACTAAVLIVFVCTHSLALADRWMLPTTQIFLSPDKSKRLTVSPRELSNQLEYFTDKEAGKDQAGQKTYSPNIKATAKLESLSRNMHWELLWQRELPNDVSPVSALVTDDGRYVVTFDNWHHTGFGEHVIVIYGNEGRLIRSLSLGDFLPEAYVATLPRSVSSLLWGDAHHFDAAQENVVLRVAEPFDDSSEHDFDEDGNFTDIPVSLVDGNVTMPTGPTWEALLTRAERIHAKDQ